MVTRKVRDKAKRLLTTSAAVVRSAGLKLITVLNLDWIMHEEFIGYLRTKGLKATGQRSTILKTFMGVKSHVSAEELHARVRKQDPAIGQATVFRFMKLLADAGVAQVSGLGGRQARYEPRRAHHDHLICRVCGRLVEFTSDTIEKEQERIASVHGFQLKDHRMELYGSCADCRAKGEKRARS